MTEERLRFVARILEGEGMSEVCREFGISRKTGYKIFNRYNEVGLDARCDRSRRPVRYANQLPDQLERLIVDLKRDKPHWGARKIRELLVRKLAADVRLPAKSTVHAVLDRHGLVKRARQRRNRPTGTPLSAGAVPNALWCADFKGEFKLGNGRYCYPLTVSDHASRYLLLCEAFESTREAPVIEAFQQLFRDRGLPVAIRSDNGVPFASPNGLYNLSRLSVWWLRLGIAVERIKPGKTVLLVDVSGSMDAGMAAKSGLNRMDAAATLASIVPGDVRVFTFSNQTVEVPPRHGMAGVDAITRSQPHAGTMLGQAVTRINGLGGVDRLIVITDEQSHDRVPEPAAKWAYMINVAAYKNGVGYGRWTHIDGFSEAVLRFIAEFERTKSSGDHREV